ncbi:MAG: hypothetical protein COV91_00235, partial [Candidatus Taylorbacteria bacterium CG11_big_fil_rev_8_21_14_0_20_46_11]
AVALFLPFLKGARPDEPVRTGTCRLRQGGISKFPAFQAPPFPSYAGGFGEASKKGGIRGVDTYT